MNNYCISVVMPIYNPGYFFLNRALESVLNQTYKNIEVICVNDGSTDNTQQTLEAFRRKDKRIHIVNQQNAGLVSAVVKGVENANGEYIAFLDSDDYYDKDYLNFLISNIGKADFLSTGHYSIYEDGIQENRLLETKILDKEDLSDCKQNLIWDEKTKGLSNRLCNARWNKLYTKEIVSQIISYYRECSDISLGEDTIFTYLILKYAKMGKVISESKGYYYNKKNSSSMCKRDEVNSHMKKCLLAFNKINTLFLMDHEENNQAYVLYYCLVEMLFQRLEYGEDASNFNHLYNLLRDDQIYKESLKYLVQHSLPNRKKIFELRLIIPFPSIYLLLFKINKILKKGR